MVDAPDPSLDSSNRGRSDGRTGSGPSPSRGRLRTWRHVPVVTLVIGLAVLAACMFGPTGSVQSAVDSHPAAALTDSTGVIDAQRLHQPVIANPAPSPATVPTTAPKTESLPMTVAPTPTPTPTPTPAAVAPSAAATPAVAITPPTPSSVPADTEPPIATLVAQVEASGIDPGPTWTWSIGDTSAKCGAIPSNTGTGCTSGAAGSATTVFAGSPTLGLVAHEMANAETENYAVPSLMAEVTAAEAASSWSPIDAVASCLVAHFMGFQDNAAGPWQCPTALATTVAAGIR
jgi:hypothetical protein